MAKDRKESNTDTLSHRQRRDPHISYWETGDLPQEKREHELVLTSPLFTILDGTLYRIELGQSKKIVPLTSDHHQLFLKVHEGAFSDHLREAKIHGQLSRHYWWPQMRKDNTRWCQACLPCASRSVESPVRPQLTLIRVGGPFDHVEIHVLQLPNMSAALYMAQKSITKAQKQQKRQHNKASKNA